MERFRPWVFAVWMLTVCVVPRSGNAQQAPQAKDVQEYNLAQGAQTEVNLGKKLKLLDEWRAAYPETELFAARDAMFLTTYVEVKMAREAFDTAQAILSYNPRNLTALADALQMVTAIKPSPTAADLDAAELYAIMLLDDPAVFADEPRGMSEDQWAQAQTAVKTFAKGVLLAIYVQRDAKDPKRAVDDLTRLVDRDPSDPAALRALGSARARFEGVGN